MIINTGLDCCEIQHIQRQFIMETIFYLYIILPCIYSQNLILNYCARTPTIFEVYILYILYLFNLGKQKLGLTRIVQYYQKDKTGNNYKSSRCTPVLHQAQGEDLIYVTLLVRLQELVTLIFFDFRHKNKKSKFIWLHST